MKYSILLGGVLWLSLTVSGLGYLAHYENIPAEKNNLYPQVFPAESRIERDGNLPTLIFFSHPKCPCTRASLRELERLMADADGKLRVFVVFIKPEDAGEDWTNTDLRRSAEAIPNVRVLIDEDQRETKIFHAETSGLNLVYDRSGNLIFSGGITSARGHEGDNAGRKAIYEIVTRDNEEKAETFVFGCPLNKKDCREEIISNEESTIENTDPQAK